MKEQEAMDETYKEEDKATKEEGDKKRRGSKIMLPMQKDSHSQTLIIKKNYGFVLLLFYWIGLDHPKQG